MNASLIASKFLRSKPKLNLTKIWNETDLFVREIILKSFSLRPDEVPIINFYQNDLSWWLLSNKSLYIMSAKGFNKYLFKEFAKIGTPQSFYHAPEENKLSTITIYCKDKDIELSIESLSWAVIHSILQFTIGK